MRLYRYEHAKLGLWEPFAIARGTTKSVDVVRVYIEENGSIGRGECTPIARYDETVDSVFAQLESISPDVRNGLGRDRLQDRLPAGPARNAVDCALWALEGEQKGLDWWVLTGTVKPVQGIVTARTVGIGTPERMMSAATKLVDQGATLLKLKLNDTDPIAPVKGIRARFRNLRIIADANEAWGPTHLEKRCRELADLGVEMLEQPLPAKDDAGLRDFDHPLMICADESCHVADDVEELMDRYDMVNIKLDKSGGLTEALRIAERAETAGLEIMVGCMLGSSLAMRAALPIAACASVVDLDGPLWLSRDAEPELHYLDGGFIEI